MVGSGAALEHGRQLILTLTLPTSAFFGRGYLVYGIQLVCNIKIPEIWVAY